MGRPPLAPGVEVNIISSDEKEHAAWVGGSVMTSLGAFDELWIDRFEYADSGSLQMIQKKCSLYKP